MNKVLRSGLLLCLLSATPAFAQSSPPQPAARQQWTIEAYGGLSLGRVTWGGTSALPDPGDPIATSSPIFPSWQVPTWFLGDGAAFLNNVNAQFGVAQRITPLDAAIRSAGLAESGMPVGGVRIARHLRGRLWAEAGVGIGLASTRASLDLRNAVQATQDSFVAAFGALLAEGPFTNVGLTTTSDARNGSAREITVTGAVQYVFDPIWRFTPYVVGGGGFVAQAGDAPVVNLSANYEFRIAGLVPVNETDTIAIRLEQGVGLVAVGGGGVRRPLKNGWALQIDARVLVGRDTSRILINATPTMIAGMPADFIESFTYPNLQFSNNASTGRVSTLGGAGLRGFETYSGGYQTRFRITVGLVRTF